MSERMEWRRLYGRLDYPGRETLFLDGVAVGDFYPTTGDVYRVRLWPEDRLQGGRERLVLTEEAARAVLVQLLERARREAAD